ncbi:tautomerase family protein [Paucibacter sp. M5-1]|uniref:tautomerase family protein n=1 Tax=Paucibacter sp. M5-1 TaxID=3015998 RepID=UPI0022B86B43|nr:tautomerase family protein [Paucibacter sp. M5-1]MCZ7880076.1 tautomerase family protein [Paucibacter sp. M5-1]
MPNVYIHVRRPYEPAQETMIMQAVQDALVKAFGVDPTDTNIVLMEHPAHRFLCPPDRDDATRYTNITVIGHASRSIEAKRLFYLSVVENLESVGIPRNCSLIQIHELPPENIAIRGGQAMSDMQGLKA